MVSATVVALASTDAETYDDRGELTLKGVPSPVPAFTIRQAPPSTAASETADPSPVASDSEAVVRLLHQRRYEEAAEIALEVNASTLADALLKAGGRVEFLDVDITLVRMLQDVLERLPEDDAVRRSRTSAKLAFELRGDPSTAQERRELLDLATPSSPRVHLARALRSSGDTEGADRRLAEARETARSLGMARLLAQLEAEAEADGR